MRKFKKLKQAVIRGLIIAVVAAGAFPVGVFAQSKEATCICKTKCTEDNIQEACEVCLYDYNFCEGKVVQETGNLGPLTPDGNMELVDDYGSLEASGKQFITVTTKSGNYFYLIIDRDAKGTENVHFLNLVDESDLLALMETDEKKAYLESQTEKEEPKNEETEPDSEKVAEAEPVTKESPNLTGIMGMILIISLCGLGGFGYLKFRKNKDSDENQTDPDEDYFDDEDDEDYLANLDIGEEPMPDQEMGDISEEEDIQTDDSDVE